MDKKTTIAGLLIVMLFIGTGSASAFDIVAETKNNNGEFVDTQVFYTNEDLYVWGCGFTGHVDIYVVTDKNWEDGQSFADDIIKTKSDVLLLCNYNNPAAHILVWPNPLDEGKYDVIVDTNGDKIYDSGPDGLDAFNAAGFTVTPELSTMSLMGVGLISMLGYIGISKRHRI